ncbi:hypothetical protein J2Y58_004049 [Sphingomonas sp. BE138]|uniref:nuclear transport factor 2 family protein n=1 Tax=Sphingomonas sp. BE138 TaxID=2817845 RepID=UPI00285CE7B6|nr:nuclear transport factor 2 family protein [Sphingomonas sp. BE138]MDR6790666.1 hypothetical protein [Sphingomonas sp. BE138]
MAITPAASLGSSDDVDGVSRRFDDLQYRGDRAGIEAIVSPRLRYITGTGDVRGREAFLAATTVSGSRLNPFDIREREIVRMGDRSAAVLGLATISGSDASGRRFSRTLRYLDLFERIDGRWRVVLVQVTPVAASLR